MSDPLYTFTNEDGESQVHTDKDVTVEGTLTLKFKYTFRPGSEAYSNETDVAKCIEVDRQAFLDDPIILIEALQAEPCEMIVGSISIKREPSGD